MKSGADVMKTEINRITPYMLSSAVELTDVMNMIWKTGTSNALISKMKKK
jgi:hypothetical protein